MKGNKRLWIGAVAVLALFLAASCAKEPQIRKPVGAMDTPSHHVLSGLRLLEQDRYDDAEREFNLAIELDPKFSRAYSGLGIVYGLKGDFKAAYAQMEKAEDYMKENQEKLDYHVGMIRILSAERGDDWVDKVENHFKKAVKVDENYAPAYYFTGMAYRKAYEFGKAADMFSKFIFYRIIGY